MPQFVPKPAIEFSLSWRIKRFWRISAGEKYMSVMRRIHSKFSRIIVPVRLPFGMWWLARHDHVSKPILEGTFENSEYSFVRRFLQPGMNVLDIGAHHGFYTLLASRLVGPKGRVFSFEPSPRERRALLLHIRLNFCKNVMVEPMALGSEAGQANLHVVQGSLTGCNSLRPPAVHSETSSIPVRVDRLDDWLGRSGLRGIDFIKLDVEGGELGVLQGADELLQRRPRPVILAEVQDVRTRPWGYAAKDIIEYLSQRDFLWYRLSESGQLEELDLLPSQFDGNFVACPREREERFRTLMGALFPPIAIG